MVYLVLCINLATKKKVFIDLYLCTYTHTLYACLYLDSPNLYAIDSRLHLSCSVDSWRRHLAQRRPLSLQIQQKELFCDIIGYCSKKWCSLEYIYIYVGYKGCITIFTLVTKKTTTAKTTIMPLPNFVFPRPTLNEIIDESFVLVAAGNWVYNY